MEVQVEKILSDISYFSEHICGIGFEGPGGGYSRSAWFPSIANWKSGEIVLETLAEGRANDIIKRLQGYGIQAQLAVQYQRQTSVKFTAKAGDDIISILYKAMTDRVQREDVKRTKHQLLGLNQHVDMLIEQLPYVKRGVFSRGVNAFRNQVETLKNIRASHIKHR